MGRTGTHLTLRHACRVGPCARTAALATPAEEAERAAAEITTALTELPRRDGAEDERLQARASTRKTHAQTLKLHRAALSAALGADAPPAPQPLLDAVEELHCFVVLNYLGKRYSSCYGSC